MMDERDIFVSTDKGWKVNTSPKAALPGVYLNLAAAHKAYRSHLIQTEQAKLKREANKKKD